MPNHTHPLSQTHPQTNPNVFTSKARLAPRPSLPSPLPTRCSWWNPLPLRFWGHINLRDAMTIGLPMARLVRPHQPPHFHCPLAPSRLQKPPPDTHTPPQPLARRNLWCVTRTARDRWWARKPTVRGRAHLATSCATTCTSVCTTMPRGKGPSDLGPADPPRGCRHRTPCTFNNNKRTSTLSGCRLCPPRTPASWGRCIPCPSRASRTWRF